MGGGFLVTTDEEGSENNDTKKLKLKLVYNKKELIQKAKKVVAFIL